MSDPRRELKTTVVEQSTFEGPGREMVQRLYYELRQLAAVKLRHTPFACPPLQPTALVHEVYMRLSKDPGKIWEGRRHFFQAAALAMRQVLIDRARARRSQERGGEGQKVDITITLADREDTIILRPEEVLTFDRALHKLKAQFPELLELVLMRYFCGLTLPEIADLLEVSQPTVKRKWSFARAWLLTEIDGMAAC